MYGLDSDSLSNYLAKEKLNNEVIGWALFTTFAIMPVFVLASMIIDLTFMWVFILAFFCVMGMIPSLEWKARRFRLGFWIDTGVVKRLKSRSFVIYMFISGAIVGGSLTMIFFWMLMSRRFGMDFWEYLEMGIEAFVLLIEFAIFLPVLHLINRHLVKKHKLEMARTKYVHGNKAKMERIVEKAITDLRLGFSEGQEGSRWWGLVPVLKIDEHEISIHTFPVWPKQSGVTVTARRVEDYEIAERIQKSIDSSLWIIS